MNQPWLTTSDWPVIMAAADEARKLEQDFPGALKMLQADLADPESFSGLADSLRGEGLD